MKYIEWLQSWPENYVKPTSKIRTYERYKRVLNPSSLKCIGFCSKY